MQLQLGARKINPVFGWQSRFYDCMFRDPISLDNIRKCIKDNSKKKRKGYDQNFLIQQVKRERNKIPLDKFLMIGDKHFDILGAKSNEIRSLGVLYGFGSEKELKRAGADYLVKSVIELKDFLFKCI